MNNFVLFFIGIALLSIFGSRIFPILIIGYLLYKRVIEPNMSSSKNKWKGIENWLKSFLQKGSISSEDAKFYDPKNSKTNNSSFNSFNMNFLNTKRILLAVVGLIFLFIIIDGFVSVPAGTVAVIYDRGRGVLNEELPEGLHLKIPFWQVATIMDTRLQTYTMSIADREGEIYGDDSIESLTRDGQKVLIDVTIQYRIKGDDAPWIYKEVGSDYVSKIVRPGVRNVLRDVITGYDSTKLFKQESRMEAQEKMREALSGLYGKNKVQLEAVLLRNIKFSEVYLQSIEDKQVAQQRIQKSEFEKQEAEIKKQTKIIEAEAEAESIKLKGQSLRQNPAVIQFEMVQKLSPNIKWGVLPDGVLPMLNMDKLE